MSFLFFQEQPPPDVFMILRLIFLSLELLSLLQCLPLWPTYILACFPGLPTTVLCAVQLKEGLNLDPAVLLCFLSLKTYTFIPLA